MKKDSLLRFAVQNNAEWCDIFCRSHGVSGFFDDGLWYSRDHVPDYYPNLITLSAAQEKPNLQEKVCELFLRNPKMTFIKDSFADMELAEHGFVMLFDAQWLLAPNADRDMLPQPDTIARFISETEELADWEKAWSGGKTTDLFRPSLLKDMRVRIAAVYRAEHIVAGAVFNKSEDVIGISNVFYKDEPSLYWRLFINLINTEFPDVPVVGYEHGDDLANALKAGCKKLGPLRIWKRR